MAAMTTKAYIDSLFKDYDESKALADFKEELQSNLEAKIASLEKKGLSGDEAFKKATAELGDVGALADEISLKKKQEVFEEVYMDIKRYMNPARVVGYVASGLALAFGIITALIAYFSINLYQFDEFAPNGFVPQGAPHFLPQFLWDTRFDLVGALGTLLAYVPLAVAGFTFLGLTQETAAVFPMKKKRAVWYAVGAWLITFGVILLPLVYFSAGPRDGLVGGIGSLLPFTLSGGGLLAFLSLTEKNRLKPWLRARVAMEYEMFNDPKDAMRFGLFSGAIWIFAFALFFLLGFVIGFRYSWLVFVFAVGFQLILQAVLSKKGGGAGGTV